MKLSHFGILSVMITLICFIQWNCKFQMLQKSSYLRFCYNQIVDNAVEDGLYAGVKQEKTGVYSVDEEKAIEGFRTSLLLGFGLLEGSAQADRLLSCIGCVVIMQEEYFTVFSGDERASYYYADCENGGIDAIEECVQDALKEKFPKNRQYQIDFPDIEEEACHTLEGISMISFMQYDEYWIDEFACNRYTLSGARLEERK